MISELQDQSHEERLARDATLTLKKGWERGDTISLYRLVNGMEQLDREDLLVYSEREREIYKRTWKEMKIYLL